MSPTHPHRFSSTPPGPTELLRVLVVDDSPDERFFVRRALERSPDGRFEVVDAATADAGLGATRDEVFDVAVIDHQLPDRPGLELVEQLRRREPDLALVLLTGQGSDELARAALEAGVDDYLNKNAVGEARRLGRAVRGAVERCRLRSQVEAGNEALATAHAELVRYQRELEALVQSRTIELEREVIQRREAEEALREQQERYERATRAGGVGIWEVEVASGRLFVDETVADVLGPAPAVLDRDWLEARVHGEDWTEARARLDAHLRGDLPVFEMELRARSRNGSVRWFEARATSGRDADGTPLRTFGTLVDTTARKRAELETARYASALARSNSELEQFAHVASHDLRAPLRRIRTFGESLGVRYGSVLDERGRDYVQRICTGAVHLERLVDRVFAYSRLQQETPNLEILRLQSTVWSAWNDVDDLAHATGGTLEVTGELPMVRGDSLQLRQLFSNLFSNALKYRHDHRSPRIEVSSAQVDGGILVTVVDNGIGFEQEVADSIFEPFLRLRDDPRVDGTGMGLAICRRVAERHGGWLSASGRTGEGATFEVFFPDWVDGTLLERLRESSSEAPAQPARASAPAGRRPSYPVPGPARTEASSGKR